MSARFGHGSIQARKNAVGGTAAEVVREMRKVLVDFLTLLAVLVGLIRYKMWKDRRKVKNLRIMNWQPGDGKRRSEETKRK